MKTPYRAIASIGILAIAAGASAAGTSTRQQAFVMDGCLVVTGTPAGDHITLRLRAGVPQVLEVDLGVPGRSAFRFDRDLFDCIRVHARGGDDLVVIDESNGSFTDTEITSINGDGGNDTLLGGSGPETLRGGDGDDIIDGSEGDDLVFMGHGDDAFQWTRGDGSDTIDGEGGADAVHFFGSDEPELIEVRTDGGNVELEHHQDNAALDLVQVESIDLRTLGGADDVVVDDLSGTDMTGITVDLRGTDGGGDEAADAVTIRGTNSADVFGAAGDVGGIIVFGLQAAVEMYFTEPGLDQLTLEALAGDDVVDATSLEAGAIQLTITGGLGDDVMLGSEDNDLIVGGDGNDLALMNAGDDTFVWSPGDDDDILEGQGGFDEMIFNGANVAEQIDIFANGGRVFFTRDVANVVMDLDDVERISFLARGGADTILVDDLSGTDAVAIEVELAEETAIAAPDTIFVQGTAGDDVIVVFGDSTGTTVLGLSVAVDITGAAPSDDRVTINALAGDDVVDGSGLEVGAIQLTANGGADHDVLMGGDGHDVLVGGSGDDVLLGGPGLDVLDGGSGDNVVIQ